MIGKEMCFEEQIIFKEKEATIFWCKIEVIVFHILQTFCNAYCFFCNNHL